MPVRLSDRVDGGVRRMRQSSRGRTNERSWTNHVEIRYANSKNRITIKRLGNIAVGGGGGAAFRITRIVRVSSPLRKITMHSRVRNDHDTIRKRDHFYSVDNHFFYGMLSPPPQTASTLSSVVNG